MLDYIKMLREFHVKFRHDIQYRPTISDKETRTLRSHLIYEEAMETCEAIRFTNLTEIADGLADLLYVTFGTALSFGIPIEEVFKEVHRSNMSKSAAKNSYGKTIKGESFSAPNIKGILSRKEKE